MCHKAKFRVSKSQSSERVLKTIDFGFAYCNHGTLQNTSGTLPEPCGALWNPCAPGPSHSPRRTSWNPETLMEPYLKPPRTIPRRTSWNPARTLAVEPSCNLTLQNLVEPWWNPRGTLPQGRPGPPRSLFGLRSQSFQLLGGGGEKLILFVKQKT